MKVKARTKAGGAVLIAVAGLCCLVCVATVSLRAERDVEAVAPRRTTSVEVVPVGERGRKPVEVEESANEE